MRVGLHLHHVVNFILPFKVGNAAGNRVLLIDEVKTNVALEPFGLRVAGRFVGPDPCAANDALAPFVLIIRHHGIMDDDHATTALEEFFKTHPLIAHDLHSVRGIDDEDIGAVELLGGWERHRPAGLEAAFAQQLGPVRQETRVVVLVGAVRFDAGPDEDTERCLGGLKRACGPDKGGNEQGMEKGFGFHGFGGD